MISTQTRSAFVARENRFPLFRIMLKRLVRARDVCDHRALAATGEH